MGAHAHWTRPDPRLLHPPRRRLRHPDHAPLLPVQSSFRGLLLLDPHGGELPDRQQEPGGDGGARCRPGHGKRPDRGARPFHPSAASRRGRPRNEKAHATRPAARRRRRQAGADRRTFLASAAAATAGFTIVPRHVLGGQATPAPSDKLNIACVGVGGMGKTNLDRCETENIVALCDVDFGLADPVFKKYPSATAVQGLPRHAGRAEGHRRGHRRDARSQPRRDRHGRHGAQEARLRAEAADPFRLRSPAADRDRPQVRGRDPDGQPGAFGRRRPPAVRVGLGRRHRPRARGARLDQPPRLAVRHRAGPAHGDAGRSRRARLGPLARPRRRLGRITRPITRPSGAPGGTSAPARSATWRATSSIRCSGRCELKYPVSVEANISKYWHAFFEQTEAKNETFPLLDDRALQVPRARKDARGRRDLVGRGPDAGAPRRARTGSAPGRQRRRDPADRRRGRHHGRLLRRVAAARSGIRG